MRKKVFYTIIGVLGIVGCTLAIVLMPLGFSQSVMDREYFSSRGFEIRDNKVIDLQNLTPVVSKESDRALEDFFGASSMPDDIIELYHTALLHLSTMEQLTTGSTGPLVEYLNVYRSEIDTVYQSYVVSKANVYLGTTSSQYFLRSILIEIVVQVEKKNFVEAMDYLTFVLKHLGSLRYFSQDEIFNYTYDKRCMELCIKVLSITGLLGRLENKERLELVQLLQNFREDGFADNWRRTSKIEILQYALNGTHSRCGGLNTMFGSNSAWLYNGKSLLSSWYVRRELYFAEEILDGKRCMPPQMFSGVYSSLAKAGQEGLYKAATHYELSLSLIAWICMIEEYHELYGNYPKSLELLSAELKNWFGLSDTPAIFEGIGVDWEVDRFGAGINCISMSLREISSECDDGNVVLVSFVDCRDLRPVAEAGKGGK